MIDYTITQILTHMKKLLTKSVTLAKQKDENNMIITIKSIEEMVKNALLKTIHEKYGDVSEEDMSNIINQLADNLDDEEDEDDIIENREETIEGSPVVLEYDSRINANFVAIDLETATSERSSICQIGITEVIDGKICDTKSWLVQPEGNRYDSMNIWVHGITK